MANALRLLRELKVNQFKDSYATGMFVRHVDAIFDVLNVRQPGGSGRKAAVTRETIASFEKFVDDQTDFLMTLEDRNGDQIIRTRKSTGFLSFVFCLRSHLNICKELFANTSITYVLSYKFSQDHIELLFNCIRRSCGWNNNPSAVQFANIFRRLLKRIGVESSSTGNCLRFDDEEIEPNPFEERTEDIVKELDLLSLSHFSSSVTAYIAGFLLKRFIPRMKCDACKSCLISQNLTDLDPCDRPLLRLRNNGGLVLPSTSLVKLIQTTEMLCKELGGHFFPKRSISTVIVQSVREKNLFSYSHFNETDHLYSLITNLAMSYVDLRAQHYSKSVNSRIFSKRHQLNKLVLFNSM